MLRIAVIGSGRIGVIHAATVAAHPQAELTLICDPITEACEPLAKKYGARICTDPNEVFSADDVDAVVIGSPTPFHAEHILAAAKAKKPALCEKPVASSVEEALDLQEKLASYPDSIVMVGFQRRYDPSVAKAHRLASEGTIGTVEQLTLTSRDPAPPSKEYLLASGGIFKDMTIHDFDEVRFFLGEVESVSAIGQKLDPELADVDDFDGAVVMLRAKSGAVGVINNTRHCASGYDQRIEIFGTKGTLNVGNLYPTSVEVSNDTITGAKEPYLDFFLERYMKAYTNELNAFIDAVNNGAEITPTVEDGVKALVLAQAAEKSARTGQIVEL